MTYTFPNSHFISVIDDAAGKMYGVFINVLKLCKLNKTNQTVMTQKLQNFKINKGEEEELFCTVKTLRT